MKTEKKRKIKLLKHDAAEEKDSMKGKASLKMLQTAGLKAG